MKKSILATIILLFSAIIVLLFACSKNSYNGSGGEHNLYEGVCVFYSQSYYIYRHKSYLDQ